MGKYLFFIICILFQKILWKKCKGKWTTAVDSSWKHLHSFSPSPPCSSVCLICGPRTPFPSTSVALLPHFLSMWCGPLTL